MFPYFLSVVMYDTFRYLQNCDKTFDLVVAADVLSYVGDLQPTFELVSKVLRPGGHFAFTVESTSEDAVQTGRGYRLLHRYVI